MIQIDDRVRVRRGSLFTHRCVDEAVGLYIGNGYIRIYASRSCWRCEEVGHKKGHVYAYLNQLVRVPIACLHKAGDDGWFNADWEWVGYRGLDEY